MDGYVLHAIASCSVRRADTTAVSFKALELVEVILIIIILDFNILL